MPTTSLASSHRGRDRRGARRVGQIRRRRRQGGRPARRVRNAGDKGSSRRQGCHGRTATAKRADVTYEFREINEDNLPELHRVASTAFGEEPKQERIDDEKLVIEYDRMIGVADGDELVASAGVYSFDLTVPGGGLVPMAGVTWVSCLPSH